MTQGFLYRVNQSQALAYSAWSTRHTRRLIPEVDDVVTVHVRIRQQDMGVLYETGQGIKKTPLSTYKAGEHLDCYA